MRFVSVLAVVLALAACKKSEPPAPPPQQPQGAAPGPQAAAIKGKVAERIDAAPYSYLRLTTAQGEVWAAVPQSNVASGAEVTVEGPMAMAPCPSPIDRRAARRPWRGLLELAGEAE